MSGCACAEKTGVEIKSVGGLCERMHTNGIASLVSSSVMPDACESYNLYQPL